MIFLTKSQERAVVFRGEITAFLLLLFLLVLSVIGALLQSAVFEMNKMETRARTSLALESFFAEYHVPLLEEYEVFARFGCSEEVMQNRMQYYGAIDVANKYLTHEVLTDNAGYPFYEQAIRYMKDWLGAEEVEGVIVNSASGKSVEKQQEKVSTHIGNLLEEHDAVLPAEDNPLESTERIKTSGLLQVVVEHSETLSNRCMETSSLCSTRELKKGNYKGTVKDNPTDKAFFVAYASTHFSNVLEQNENRPLLYEMEYLFAGHTSDKENLEDVCKTILLLRMAINYTYLQTSSTRKAEAELLAASLCTLITLPELTQAVQQAILLAWAYGESIVDMRVLLKNEKVPFIKTDENWQLQLENLVDLGTAEEVTTEKPSKEGISYETYLTGLLLLESRETLSMRSLDLIEEHLNIKADECMTKAVIETTRDLGYGGKRTFQTAFGYQ